ncbi:MAG: DUF6677 family protein [Phycisphaerales bacterium]|jgi:hypothetical protein
MGQSWKENHALYLIVVGAAAWLVPGGGHYVLNEKKRAAVIFTMVVLTFLVGLYVGSIGVIDSINAKPWYAAQVMNSPVVIVLGSHVASLEGQAQKAAAGGREPSTPPYRVYGRANEIGQIYTSVAGLLNLLCIVNAIYVAHLRAVGEAKA